MATNKPETRKTHITRIFGTNKEGDRLDDVWADVERMDLVKSATQVPNTNPLAPMQWQGYQRKFRWCDDPNGDDYEKDGTPSRKHEILKVCDPENEDDVDDPEEWIPIKVIKGLRARVETGTQDNGGTAQERFLASVTADELRTARVVETRKIVHYDTNIDDAAQAAFDSGQDAYVVSSEEYEKDESTKEDDQYVDHEIITYLKHKGNAAEVSGIGRQTKLLNRYLLDENDAAQGDVVGKNGFNPPYRLDPYQNIVNIKFGPTAVKFYDGAS